jgi:methylmalonyl-CoA mutase N-terminal domain/subunit
VTDEKPAGDLFSVNDNIRKLQTEKITQLKNERNAQEVKNALENLSDAAKNGSNLMPFILTAVEAYSTLGEIADCMRNVFGEYKG